MINQGRMQDEKGVGARSSEWFKNLKKIFGGIGVGEKSEKPFIKPNREAAIFFSGRYTKRGGGG